jgi:hypothetical protein
MTDIAQPALGALGAEDFARLVDQLPVVVWSTDVQLRVTSRYGGVLAAFGLAPGGSPENQPKKSMIPALSSECVLT